MAYDKIIVIHSRLDRCLDYVQNDGKTDLGNAVDYICNPDKAGFQTAINCTLDKSFLQMQETKRRWDKHGGILGYHIIHSYAPGEVTPEQAHEAGVEFARRLLGDKYEAVVCTHTDRDHLHCHIVFNSVSFMDGKKYRSDFKSYFHDLRGISNEVSRERGYSVIEPDGKGASYAAWNAEKRGSGTIRDLIRRDIDAALAGSLTYDTFLETLRRQGYSVKRSPNVKHTAVRPPGGQRFVRVESLGLGYTEAELMQRLNEQRHEPEPTAPVFQHKSAIPFAAVRAAIHPSSAAASALCTYIICIYCHRVSGNRRKSHLKRGPKSAAQNSTGNNLCCCKSIT